MKPTRLSVLLGITVVTTAFAFAAVRVWERYSELPRVPVSAPVTLLALAVAVLATALALRNRLRQVRERRPDAKPLDPLLAARAVVLAKASSVVGSLFVGLYAGYGMFLLGDLEIEPRRQRLVMCGLCVLAGLLLIAVALFLERVCRIPPSPRDKKDVEDRPLFTPDPP